MLITPTYVGNAEQFTKCECHPPEFCPNANATANAFMIGRSSQLVSSLAHIALPHDPSPPTTIHAHSIIRPNGDTQARIIIVLRCVPPPQRPALRLAPLGVDDEPRGAAVGVFLLHELQLGAVAASGLGRLW